MILRESPPLKATLYLVPVALSCTFSTSTIRYAYLQFLGSRRHIRAMSGNVRGGSNIRLSEVEKDIFTARSREGTFL
jgi:hypothetical protein